MIESFEVAIQINILAEKAGFEVLISLMKSPPQLCEVIGKDNQATGVILILDEFHLNIVGKVCQGTHIFGGAYVAFRKEDFQLVICILISFSATSF